MTPSELQQCEQLWRASASKLLFPKMDVIVRTIYANPRFASLCEIKNINEMHFLVLFEPSANHDKYYVVIDLKEIGIVMAYGRRGVTPCWISRANMKNQNQVVGDKLKKGYKASQTLLVAFTDKMVEAASGERLPGVQSQSFTKEYLALQHVEELLR